MLRMSPSLMRCLLLLPARANTHRHPSDTDCDASCLQSARLDAAAQPDSAGHHQMSDELLRRHATRPCPEPLLQSVARGRSGHVHLLLCLQLLPMHLARDQDKRLEANVCSSIYAQFTESINGVVPARLQLPRGLRVEDSAVHRRPQPRLLAHDLLQPLARPPLGIVR